MIRRLIIALALCFAGGVFAAEPELTISALDCVAKSATIEFAASNEVRRLRFYYGNSDYGDDIDGWRSECQSVSYEVPANVTSLSVALPAEWGETVACGRFVMHSMKALPVDSFREYIQGYRADSSIGSTIKTGIYPDQNAVIELDFAPTATTYNQALFCARTNGSSSDRLVSFIFTGGNAKYDFGSVGTQVDGVYEAGTRYVMKTLRNQATIYKQSDLATPWKTIVCAGAEEAVFKSDYELILFMSGVPSSSPGDNAGTWRLYSFKLRNGENGPLLADYRPAQKGSTAGVYDSVSGKFIASSAQGFSSGSVTEANPKGEGEAVGSSASVVFLGIRPLECGADFVRLAVSVDRLPADETAGALYLAVGPDAEHLGEYQLLASGVSAGTVITNVVDGLAPGAYACCAAKLVAGSATLNLTKNFLTAPVMSVTGTDRNARTVSLVFPASASDRRLRFYYGDRDYGADVDSWSSSGGFASYEVPPNTSSLTAVMPAEWGESATCGRFVMVDLEPAPVDSYLEYIQACRNSNDSKDSYLKTGLYPNQNSTVELDFTPTSVAYNQALFCARTDGSSSDRFVSFIFTGGNAKYDFGSVGAQVDGVYEAGTRYVMRTCRNQATIYRQSDLATPWRTITCEGAENAVFTSAHEMALFMSGIPSSTPNNNSSSWKLHSFRMRQGENGPLVADYRPAKKGSAVGVHDAVSGRFISSGGAAFTAGPVTNASPKVEKVTRESVGVSAVDVGVAERGAGYVKLTAAVNWLPAGESSCSLYLATGSDAEHLGGYRLLASEVAVGSVVTNLIDGIAVDGDICFAFKVKTGSSEMLEHKTISVASLVTTVALDNSAKTAKIVFPTSSAAREMRFYYGNDDPGIGFPAMSEPTNYVAYAVPSGTSLLSVNLPAAWGESAVTGRFVMVASSLAPVDAFLDYVQAARASVSDPHGTYLLTGIKPNQNTAIELDFTLYSLKYNQALFCARTDGSSPDQISCFIYGSGAAAKYDFMEGGGALESGVFTTGTRYVLKSFGSTARLYRKSDLSTVWRTLSGGGSQEMIFTAPEMVLFMSGAPSSQPDGHAGSWKLHSFRMRDGEKGPLLADYQPARKGATYGVYDHVSGRFRSSDCASYSFFVDSGDCGASSPVVMKQQGCSTALGSDVPVSVPNAPVIVESSVSVTDAATGATAVRALVPWGGSDAATVRLELRVRKSRIANSRVRRYPLASSAIGEINASVRLPGGDWIAEIVAISEFGETASGEYELHSDAPRVGTILYLK